MSATVCISYCLKINQSNGLCKHDNLLFIMILAVTIYNQEKLIKIQMSINHPEKARIKSKLHIAGCQAFPQ